MMNFKNQEKEQGETQNATLAPEELDAIDNLIAQNLKTFFKKNKKLMGEEQEDCYVLPEDIKDIIEEFSDLERQIKACENDATDSYIELLNAIVESTVRTRIKELSRQRMTEKVKERASADAKDYYQTPRYYRPWRRFFRLTPNRAMQLINEQEELVASLLHLGHQINNDELRRQLEREQELYNNGISEDEEDVETLPERKARTKTEEENEEEQGGQALKIIN
ncbi:MAG: hypothetical protein ACI4MB_05740 [Candidatus Coproplasma sp.]